MEEAVEAVVAAGVEPFPTVDKCDASGRGAHAVVADLDGALLRSRSAFPYYALVAFEAGGVPRLLLLLLLAPLAAALRALASESACARVLVFAATAGARVRDIESAARAVLPRFYAADVHPAAWRVFSACARRRVVLTAAPRIMAEPFLRDCLGADAVAGTELATWRGRATGMVDSRRGVLVGWSRADALREILAGDDDDDAAPDVGLGNSRSDYPFMSMCKVVDECGYVVDMGEQSLLTNLGGEDDRVDTLDLYDEGIPNLMKPPTPKFMLEKYSYVSIMCFTFITKLHLFDLSDYGPCVIARLLNDSLNDGGVTSAMAASSAMCGLAGRLSHEAYIVPRAPVEPLPMDQLPRPVIFHDGLLVRRPTPLAALLVVLWFPVGFALACLRIAAGALLPMPLVYYAFWALGVRVHVRGAPPPPRAERATGRRGVLFACSHRTLLDPIFLSTALGRPVAAVTYSLSRLSEFLSPIRTVRLTRDRASDAAMIRDLLAEGDLVICPEGTTCREPFLLRFSALFAELTHEVVPVAMENRMSMFHGTTARGWKGMDPFYFFMNPSPAYVVTFLNKLPPELTCAGGRTSHEVANYIQRLIAATLSYECTSLTRKDKYLALAGNDGVVATPKPPAPAKKPNGC
uniref:Phospholipid/glycerol acyltransferase domain-containing protein n=1 Tax=Zea mays TaxID=4577 RepID=Q5GAR7_MAIZE|nr:hypothetical protein B9002 [Zea mays]